VHDRVGLANIREELVPEPLPLGRALYEPCDVDELHDSGDDLFRLDDVRDARQARVRHLDHADVRLNRAKRVVLSGRTRGGKGIEQRRLPDVGKSDDSEFQHGAKLNGQPPRLRRGELYQLA
jgi:hypothetical protein